MPISAQAGEIAQTSYDTGLVALSYAISVLGSFVALTAAQRVRLHQRLDRINLLAAGAALGGIGVWSMHFTGMLALELPMGSGYSMVETLISLVAAIAATSAALAFVAQKAQSTPRLLAAGVMLGMGVVVMHYLGMHGMRFPGYIVWDWARVGLSVAIAIVAASAALWLAFRTRSLALRTLAALVMGLAVCSMHYTGMSAAEFVCTAPPTLRMATPVGFGVVNSLNLPLFTAITAIGLGLLIGFDQWNQRHLRLGTRHKKP